MKYLFTILLLTLATLSAAQNFVGTGFNYQGQLLDNGVPANGNYDFVFFPFNIEVAGNPLNVSLLQPTNIPVVEGLFNIANIDFGMNVFDAGEEVWMEIGIKKSADVNFEFLPARQRISAVPFSYKAEVSDFSIVSATANNLSPNGANTNDVLTFDGSQWLPVADKWQHQNSILSTTNNGAIDKVVIGSNTTNSNARLTVAKPNIGEIVRFEGTDRVYNEYRENDIAKGYVGSFQSGINSGTNDDDFEIGTSSTNGSGNFHLTVRSVPQLTITTTGFTGVGTTIPGAKLEVNAEANVNKSFSVKNNDIEKFTTHQNGGSSVGTGFVPPADGLFVQGDVKQQLNSNGMMKYMTRVNCAGPASSMISFFNGTNNSGSISVTTTNTLGRCLVNFPSNINTRYWQVTAVSDNGNNNVNCHTVTSNSQLICQRTFSGSNQNGNIMILVY